MMQHAGNTGGTYKPYTCLRAGILTLTIIFYIIWVTCIGLAAGFCFKPYGGKTNQFNGFLLAAVNTAYIFIASEIVYLINHGPIFSIDDLRKLRSANSKLLAASLIGLGVNIANIIHFSENFGYESWDWNWFDGSKWRYIHFSNYDSGCVAFGCSFSYIFTAILFILTAIYYNKRHTEMGKGIVPPQPPAIHPQQVVPNVYTLPTIGMPHQFAAGPASFPQGLSMRRHGQLNYANELTSIDTGDRHSVASTPNEGPSPQPKTAQY